MPKSHTDSPGINALYGEHLLLGASFENAPAVSRYHGEPELERLEEAMGDGAILCDLSVAQMVLFHGPMATAFVEAAFAGKRLRVGECAFEAVLTGDGSLASIPLLARTGEAEYVCGDFSARADVLAGWLSFLHSIEQNGTQPFAGLEAEEVGGTHVALALWGRKAPMVLADYLAGASVPKVGSVSSCMLDRLPCIVACPDLGPEPAYVILVPPVHAVALWRSLLSFGEVVPVGHDGFRSLVRARLSWTRHLQTGSTVRVGHGELTAGGIVRHDDSYVGARGLQAERGAEGEVRS